MEFKHVSVLLEETIDSLNICPDGIYVDGTTGGGGHSSGQKAWQRENGGYGSSGHCRAVFYHPAV